MWNTLHSTKNREVLGNKTVEVTSRQGDLEEQRLDIEQLNERLEKA